jgi:hypothetical protein
MISQHGKRGKMFAFCPGTAASLTGNEMKLYPGALRRAEVIEQISSEQRPVE